MPATPRRDRARRAPLVASLATALLLVLSGCSGSGADGANESSAGGGSAVDTAGEPAVAKDAASGEALAEGGAAEAGAAAAREVVTTGHATVVADDPAAAAGRLARLVEEAGGRVERRSETSATDEDPGSASMTVRLPADRMTGAVEALGDLGAVRDVDVQSVDVTGEGQDLDAQIAALTTSTDRLRDLMASAGTTKDLLQVEQELSERQGELDALTAQRQRLSDQVAMSTLDVELVPEPVAAAESRGGFLGGLSSGWDALVTTVQTVVLVLGVLLPWLAVAGLGYLGFRWWRRRTSPADSAGGDARGGHDDGPAGPDGPADGPSGQGAAPDQTSETVAAGR